MEKILTLRGLLFGGLGGLIAYVFMKLMAEPIIDRAIDYESGRDEAQEAIDSGMSNAHSHGGMDMAGMAADHSHGGDDELFSRTIQATFGAGTGMLAFGIAMGGIAAVVLALWLHHRGIGAARRSVLPVAGLTFAALYVLPTLKYPANPPAVGNSETIGWRSGLFLIMVLISAVAIVVGVLIHERLGRTMGARATWLGVAVAAVIMGLAYWLMPALGDLAANAGSGSSTETPQPLVDGSGTIVFPGFPADDLYRFRLYSFLAQLIMWAVIALGLERAARALTGGTTPTPSRRETVDA